MLCSRLRRGLTPGEQVLLDPSTQAAINRTAKTAYQSPSLSGNDLKKFQDAIMSSTNDPQALRIAGKYKDALDSAYGPQAQPVVAAANRATNVAKTSDEIDQWLANPQSAPKAVAGALAKNPGFYTNIRSALQPIADKAVEPTLSQVIQQKILEHTLTRPGSARALGYATGDHPVFGALTGLLGPTVVRAALNKMGEQCDHECPACGAAHERHWNEIAAERL